MLTKEQYELLQQIPGWKEFCEDRPRPDAACKVSESALLQRVNRKLAPEYEVLRKWRNKDNYYHVDQWSNTMLAEHVDLEAFARNCGVLQSHEEVVYG